MTDLRSKPGPFIECAKCHERIQSKHRHDFRWCPCGETFVDGGSAYLRCGGCPVMTANGGIQTWPA